MYTEASHLAQIVDIEPSDPSLEGAGPSTRGGQYLVIATGLDESLVLCKRPNLITNEILRQVNPDQTPIRPWRDVG